MISVGCAAERDTVGNYDESRYEELGQAEQPESVVEGYGSMPSNLTLADAELRGTMGNVGLDNEAWVDGFVDGRYATIYSTVDQAQNGSGMTIFEVSGGLDHADLAPGSRLVFEPGDLYGADDDAAFITLVGCSGPTAGAWEFDQTADSVTVDVSEGESGERVFDYTARFDDGTDTQLVSGTFSALNE